MSATSLQEIFVYEKRETRRQVTTLNRDALADRHVALAEHFTVKSNGDALDGWILPPHGMNVGQKYPAVFMIHGGPKTAYGEGFMHEMQVLSGKGYAVIYGNPHGSAGRGDAFADLGDRYGVIDTVDLIAILDFALKKYPFVDSNRVAVSGGSYGGYLVNYLIGQTKRFRAACSQRSIGNWISKFCTGDTGYFINHDRGTPWSEAATLWERSPVRWADQVQTPTLFIHGDEDMNCPTSEAFQMFTSLRFHGVPARLALFIGENHSLSRTGRPRARMRRLEEILGWFERHLK